MVAVNDGPPGPPPAGDNPGQGAGASGVHAAAAGGGPKNNNNSVTKGDGRSKFTGNTTEMKGHVFQP